MVGRSVGTTQVNFWEKVIPGKIKDPKVKQKSTLKKNLEYKRYIEKLKKDRKILSI